MSCFTARSLLENNGHTAMQNLPWYIRWGSCGQYSLTDSAYLICPADWRLNMDPRCYFKVMTASLIFSLMIGNKFSFQVLTMQWLPLSHMSSIVLVWHFSKFKKKKPFNRKSFYSTVRMQNYNRLNPDPKYALLFSILSHYSHRISIQN